MLPPAPLLLLRSKLTPASFYAPLQTIAPEKQDIILATGDGALHVVCDPEKRADSVANRLEETFVGM